MTMYPREFRLDVLKQIETLERIQKGKGAAAKVARELQLDEKLVYRWRRESRANLGRPCPAAGSEVSQGDVGSSSVPEALSAAATRSTRSRTESVE